MLKRPTPEQLLAIIQSIIIEAPDFADEKPITEIELKWLARARSAIEASDCIHAIMEFSRARPSIHNMNYDKNRLLQPLYDAYYKLELIAPSESQGAFIPAGDTWNGYSAIVKLLQRSCTELLIIDPYLDSSAYIDLAPHVNFNTSLKFLTAKNKQYHSALFSTAKKWENEPSDKCVTETRYVLDNKALHDRVIIIDANEAWFISQSLKDIAKRSPAYVTRADSETARLKIEHYTALWESCSAIEL